MVVSLGLIDPENEKKYLFEATPDMPQQLSLLEQFNGDFRDDVPDGVFLTHAHIGHYTGLMYFGKKLWMPIRYLFTLCPECQSS
jgi:pyrroloquinoline quinone biosynthesis protein B